MTDSPASVPQPRANQGVPNATPDRPISAVARAALEEAEARRQAALALELPPEQGGPRGQEPTRYGDWERKGMAVDF